MSEDQLGLRETLDHHCQSKLCEEPLACWTGWNWSGFLSIFVCPQHGQRRAAILPAVRTGGLPLLRSKGGPHSWGRLLSRQRSQIPKQVVFHTAKNLQSLQINLFQTFAKQMHSHLTDVGRWQNPEKVKAKVCHRKMWSLKLNFHFFK